MTAEIKLSIQPWFPYTTRLMVIIRIPHLMISLAECSCYVALSKLQHIRQECKPVTFL